MKRTKQKKNFEFDQTICKLSGMYANDFNFNRIERKSEKPQKFCKQNWKKGKTQL